MAKGILTFTYDTNEGTAKIEVDELSTYDLMNAVCVLLKNMYDRESINLEDIEVIYRSVKNAIEEKGEE